MSIEPKPFNLIFTIAATTPGARLGPPVQPPQGLFVNLALAANSDGKDEDHDFVFMDAIDDAVVIENDEFPVALKREAEGIADLIRRR